MCYHYTRYELTFRFEGLWGPRSNGLPSRSLGFSDVPLLHGVRAVGAVCVTIVVIIRVLNCETLFFGSRFSCRGMTWLGIAVVIPLLLVQLVLAHLDDLSLELLHHLRVLIVIMASPAKSYVMFSDGSGNLVHCMPVCALRILNQFEKEFD